MPPIERQTWREVGNWAEANQVLRRAFAVFTASDRYQPLTANASTTLGLTYPRTVVESDTTGGAVTLTFPDPATVPGFRVEVVKVSGGNTLTANSVTVTTFAGWISTGAAWRRVA